MLTTYNRHEDWRNGSQNSSVMTERERGLEKEYFLSAVLIFKFGFTDL